MLFCFPVSLNVFFFSWPFRESLQQTISLKLRQKPWQTSSGIKNLEYHFCYINEQLLCVCFILLIWSMPENIYVSCMFWCWSSLAVKCSYNASRSIFLLIFDVVVWCYGVRLSCVGFWCDATLFSALRSSDFCLNIHRDESPFSSHTLWMKLCFAGQQRRLKGPGPAVGLFVYCALKYGTKSKTYQLSQHADCVQIILHGM